jgi:hypothetical protein
MRFLPFLVLFGCVTNAGLEKPPCAETSSVVEIAGATALGYSAEGLLAALDGPATEALVWAYDDSETTMTVEIVGTPSEVRFIDREVDGGSSEDGASARCTDTLEVDTTVEVSTADDVFAESWAVTLLSSAAGSASFVQDLDSVTLVGTFDKWTYADPSTDYESLGAELQVSVVAGGGSGEVVLDGTGWADPACEEEGCTGWASSEVAGAWGGGL